MAKRVESVWLVVGESESSDHYYAVFENKPTDSELKELVYGWDGGSDEDGPGYAGSYVHISTTKQSVKS